MVGLGRRLDFLRGDNEREDDFRVERFALRAVALGERLQVIFARDRHEIADFDFADQLERLARHDEVLEFGLRAGCRVFDVDCVGTREVLRAFGVRADLFE